MTKRNLAGSEDELLLLAEKIFSLISDKRYDVASLLIDQEKPRYPKGEAHRFAAFSAVLHESLGDVDKGIALMRQALRLKPTWLPHLYRLSVMLMDAGRWQDADYFLKELIALSLAKNEVYFLDDGRFRRVVCLNMLGRADELKKVKAEIPAGTTAFIGNRLCRIDDLLE